jgi:hypothetical protein
MPVIAEAEKGYGPLPESISGVTYKIIPSWPDYAAGSDGTIWSKRKKKDCHRPSRWHRLSPSPNTWGYLLVVVNRLGARKTRTVHRLVAEAFHGECRVVPAIEAGYGNVNRAQVEATWREVFERWGFNEGGE